MATQTSLICTSSTAIEFGLTLFVSLSGAEVALSSNDIEQVITEFEGNLDAYIAFMNEAMCAFDAFEY